MFSKARILIFLTLILFLEVLPAFGMDAEITRRTLARLPGFYISIEELQSNFKQVAAASGLTREQLQRDVEIKLQRANIGILSQEQWLKTQGRPVLYININTHVEGANIAYSISVEVRQVVFTDSSPAVKTLAGTWGVNMTGIVKQGKLDIVRHDLMSMIDQFTGAYWAVNDKGSKK